MQIVMMRQKHPPPSYNFYAKQTESELKKILKTAIENQMEAALEQKKVWPTPLCDLALY